MSHQNNTRKRSQQKIINRQQIVELKFETHEANDASIKFQQLVDKYDIPNNKLCGISFDDGTVSVNPDLSACFGNLKDLSGEKLDSVIKDYLDFVQSFTKMCIFD